MEITKINETTNIDAKVSIANIDYSINYSVKENKIVSFSGNANVSGVNAGAFSVFYNPGIESSSNNFNFNFVSTVDADTRSQVVLDVDSILKEISIL